MLSRVANSVYWMARYVERAENVARFLGVNLNLLLDLPSYQGQLWEPMVQVTGDHELFEKRYDTYNQENVTNFLVFDREYPNSVITCLYNARENARSIREIISSEMWEQLNRFYLEITGPGSRELALDDPHKFFHIIRMRSHMFLGLLYATMSHGEAWHFARMGLMLERADKTSRILDVKYFLLLPKADDVGTPYDNIQWAAVLKSASALEMYRKEFHRITPKSVAQFLILDDLFPRSMRHCVIKAEESLHKITGRTPAGNFSNPAEKSLGRLRADLDFSDIEEIFLRGLHEFLDQFQNRLNQTDQAVSDSFFKLKPSMKAQESIQ